MKTFFASRRVPVKNKTSATVKVKRGTDSESIVLKTREGRPNEDLYIPILHLQTSKGQKLGGIVQSEVGSCGSTAHLSELRKALQASICNTKSKRYDTLRQDMAGGGLNQITCLYSV